MKKILLFSLMGLGVFATSSLSAQQAGKLDKQLTIENDYTRAAKPSFTQAKAKTRAGTRWYDPLVATLDYRNGDTTGLDNNTNSTFLWIDSTMRVRYSNGSTTYLGGIYLKSCGQILDPFAPRFNNHTKLPASYLGEMALRPTDAYTIDSVAVAGYYRRNKQAIVDTLVISVAFGNLSSTSTISGGGWTAAGAADLVNCYAVDTLRQGFIDYNWNAMGIVQGAQGTVITKKVILTNADTGGAYIATNIGLSVPAGNIAAMTYTFKSGDTWVPNVDTVSDFNFFRAYYTEEVAGELALYEKRDYNSCQSLENDTTGWGITYVPNYLYIGATGCSKTFTREQYWTLWKISAGTNGTVGTIDQFSKGITSEVYPNPASTEVTFGLNLVDAAKDVNIEIANSLGQVVKTVKLGAVSANNEVKSTVNIADLASGLYIYTISADGKKSSNKLMVK
jgi:hypothetical protein